VDEKEKEKLFNDLIKAKKAEYLAKDKRIELEEEIAELYENQFEGKSKTFNENIGKNKFSIVIKKNVTVTLDQDAYKKVRETLPENLRPEKIKYDIDNEGLAWLKENNSEVYKKVSDCISEKPGKTSVKVEKK
jgi:hypothetical protein